MIVLDTSFLIDLFKGERKTLSIVDSDVATTVITYHEILSGIKHKNLSLKATQKQRLRHLFFVATNRF